MGSNNHYPEERPAHLVTVDGFWIDRAPVTNERFARFIRETGHVTFAEVATRAEDYPGALAAMLFAGSLGFGPPPGPAARYDRRPWRQDDKHRDRPPPAGPRPSGADRGM